MFSKVLIANRGEIAVRVIRACREMGISTVAVYSELDRDALHVRLADEAYALGGQTAAESYIDADKILDVIRRSGAEAVHPGYGFFSENTDFAKVDHRHGREVHRAPARGDRRDGRQDLRPPRGRAGRRGRACPATTPSSPTPQQVIDFGAEHGYPVAIKAAYGGGGRGMKVVGSADEAPVPLESAQREALAYFGRDECYLERYLTKPRHVEVQLIGRPTRQRRVPRHPRLLGPAPPPEADRGSTGAGDPRGDPDRHGRGRGQGRQGLRLRERRHRGVPLRGRRVLLPGDEHPPPGRAPGHRAGHRRRPGGAPAAGRSRRGAALLPGGRGDRRPRHRVPHQRRGPCRRARSCPPPARSPSCTPRRDSVPAGTAATRPATRSPSTTTTSPGSSACGAATATWPSPA